jgi:hypothetical protein
VIGNRIRSSGLGSLAKQDEDASRWLKVEFAQNAEFGKMQINFIKIYGKRTKPD